MTSPKPTQIHLAKSPYAAVLTSWCGMSERRKRKADGFTLYCADQNPIVNGGEWTCDACAFRLRAESSRILEILGARSADVLALRDAALATSCGNHGCMCAPVRGIGTNGPCTCKEDPRHIPSAMLAWRRYATALEGQPQAERLTGATTDDEGSENTMKAVFASDAWPGTRQMMRHALGLDTSTGAKRAYRNHYSIDVVAADEKPRWALTSWQKLVAAGLATCTVGSGLVGLHTFNMHIFKLTQKGIVLVTDYSEREKEGS